MARTKLTAREWVNFTQRKFYVKTTNDVSQSNCKLADDKETIVATRIITTGEEIQCYYDASDNNKSAGDKRKQSEDYVKTTNDVSQSNCKLADDKETIVATRIITTGEEIQCYYDESDNNKSAGDKRKQSEDYDDNLRDNNDSSNTRRKNEC